MRLPASRVCLLLALCLGSGVAGPLQNTGTGTRQSGKGKDDAVSHGVGEAVGEGAKEAASSGVQEALGKGKGDAASSGIQGAVGEGAKEAASSGVQDAIGKGGKEEDDSGAREAKGDQLSHSIWEAARAPENTGSEAGRQAENIVRRGVDAAQGSDVWVASGGHGPFRSWGSQGQGNFGEPGLGGSVGTNFRGGSWDQAGNRGSPNLGINAQGAVAQPGYGAVRGSSSSGCTNAPPSGGSSGGSGGRGGSSGGSGASSGHSSGGSSGHSSGGSSGHSSGGSGGHSGGSGGGHSGGSGGHSGGSGGHSGDSGSGSGSGRGVESSRDFDQSFSVSKGSDSSASSSGSRGLSGGGNKPECDNPANEAVRIAGDSGSEEGRESSRLLESSQANYQGQGSRESSGRGEAAGELNAVNSETSPGLFNFDTFWKNFKSKLGFINWDAINKGGVLSPSNRALLYFRHLWEDFKRKTPFFNWKEITEGVDMPLLQKRAGGADQYYSDYQPTYTSVYSGQYGAKDPAKGHFQYHHGRNGRLTVHSGQEDLSDNTGLGRYHTYFLGFPDATWPAAVVEVLVENSIQLLLRPHKHQF